MIRMIVMSFSEIDSYWLLDNFKRGADLQRDQALIGNVELQLYLQALRKRRANIELTTSGQ